MKNKDINKIVGDYKYGFKTEVNNVFDTGYGLNEEVVRTISHAKKEPDWMLLVCRHITMWTVSQLHSLRV